MRSPVLKAELFGQMKDQAKEQLVTIQDMQPDVFRALVHFIYTDSLPDTDDQDGEGNRDMIQHLLVFFRKRAFARVALSGKGNVYTLRKRARRDADPNHGVAHNKYHRKRWRTRTY
jgi:hypothetical protein